jgi:hypothetical protein
MRKLSLIFASTLLVASNLGFANTRTGEFVKYALDSGDRTSSIIEGGNVAFKIGAFDPKNGANGAYHASLNYELDIVFVGKQKGQVAFKIPNEYFASDFIPKLKAAGQLDLGEFKVKYLGTEDVQTHTGFNFPACDHILIFDIKTTSKESFQTRLGASLAKAFLLQEGDALDAIATEGISLENTQLRIHLAKNIPAVGAVLVDVATTVSGFDAIAGFDYLKP